MAKIFYIGDWAIQMGPVFAETPFNYAYKGLEFVNHNKWLKEAIESTGKHQVTSIPTWDFYRMGPGEYEKAIDEHDVLIYSDVEAKNFQLAPDFFDYKKFGKQVLTFPDRIKTTVNAIKSGKHALFLGGWLSFNGEMGKGGWGRTGLKEVLPVKCLEVEDLRESTEGFVANPQTKEHPVFQNLDMSSLPPILGYNIVKPRDGFEVLANWKETNDPMIVAGKAGKGNVFAYTSDPAPHWGANFVFWKGYHALWVNVIDWITNS
jgi:uncharacterized membrane protein